MNFKIEYGKLLKYDGSMPDVIIPSSVTEIGENAFAGNEFLKSVIITRNIKIIDNSAFANCTCLEKVIILEGVTEIRYNAFKGCNNLSEIIIPESVTEIGYNAFAGTKWLENKKATEKNVVVINGIAISSADNIEESVNLEGVKEIQPEVFQHCRQIKKFIISDGVKICNNALYTLNDFNICLKSDIVSVNIPVNKKQMIKNFDVNFKFDTITQSLFNFIVADMEHKEYLFDDLEIPEYRYPLAVFMANSYESEFFRIFIDVHFEKIQEYAENNAPYLLKFIGSKD